MRRLTLKLRPKPTGSNNDHRATLEAIVRGNAVTARETYRMHRIRSRETLVDILTTHGLAQL